MAGKPTDRHNAFYGALGARVRFYRQKKHLTQEAVAHVVGLTRTSLTNIEKGRQKLLLHTFVDLAAALGVEAWQLLQSDDPTLKGLSGLRFPLDLPAKDRDWIEQVVNARQP